jgi:hypothetical protein
VVERTGRPPATTTAIRSARIAQLRGHLIGMGLSGTDTPGSGWAKEVDHAKFRGVVSVNAAKQMLATGRPTYVETVLPRRSSVLRVLFDIPPYPDTDIEETLVSMRLNDFISLILNTKDA